MLFKPMKLFAIIVIIIYGEQASPVYDTNTMPL